MAKSYVPSVDVEGILKGGRSNMIDNRKTLKLTRRGFLKVFGGAASGMALLGPGASAAPAAAAQVAAPAVLRGAKIHLLRFGSFMKSEDSWFAEVVKKEWAEPNRVTYTSEFVGTNDLQPKVAVALESGSGPDIMMMMWNWAHLYNAKLRDVSSIAEKQGAAGGGYYQWATAFCKMPSGQWKAVPHSIGPYGICYRSEWLKEIGESKFPDTWQELSRVSKVMKEKKGLPYGLALGHSYGDPNSVFYPMLWGFGGSEVDATGKKVVINSKETLAAVEFGVQLFKDGLSNEMFSWDDSSNNRAYLASQIWATSNAASIYLTAVKDFPDVAKDTEHALLPQGPKGRFQANTGIAHAIPTYVKDPKPAEELLAWLSDPKVYSTFLDAAQAYSAAPVKAFESHPVWNRYPKLTVFKDVSSYRWPGYPGPASAASSLAYSKLIIVDMFAKAMKGEKPQDVAAWAEQELKQIYASA
jgi:multiple sugar transport system substrate-binding protein